MIKLFVNWLSKIGKRIIKRRNPQYGAKGVTYGRDNCATLPSGLVVPSSVAVKIEKDIKVKSISAEELGVAILNGVAEISENIDIVDIVDANVSNNNQ